MLSPNTYGLSLDRNVKGLLLMTVMTTFEKLSQFIQTIKDKLFPNDPGHRYKVSCCLGKFSHVTKKLLVDQLKTGKIFPLKIIKGDFNLEGNIVSLGLPCIHHLKFLPFSENEVRVKQITEDGVLLEAFPKHIFQGTAFHKIEQYENKFFYIIEGRGIPKESWLSRIINALFIKLRIWNFFIRLNVVKTIIKLEQLMLMHKNNDITIFNNVIPPFKADFSHFPSP